MKFADYKAFEMTADAVEKEMENFDRIAKTADAMHPDYREIRRAMCVIGVVGQIDGHDVIRRSSVLDIIEQRAMLAATTPQPTTPRSTAEQIDAVFRRNLDLLIQNLTVNDRNEITWMAISCRGVEQGLYPLASKG